MPKSKDNLNKWIEFLDPKIFKDNLLGCSVYIAIYEQFSEHVVSQLKYFYWNGHNKGKDTFSPKYKSEVLSLDKNLMNATLKWFINNKVISIEEYSNFQELRKYRNMLTHEMMKSIFEGLSDNYYTNFNNLIDLQIKIDRWWLIEIEIPTNSNYDHIEIDIDNAMTGSQIMFKLIGDLLSDNEKTSNYYKDEFIKYKDSIR